METTLRVSLVCWQSFCLCDVLLLGSILQLMFLHSLDLMRAYVACGLTRRCAAVFVNEKQLPEKKKIQRHAWRFEDGSDVEMSWNLYMPGVGNAVIVQTGAPDDLCTA